MIRIKCPYCGERDHSEFSYGGDGSIIYPALEASADEIIKYTSGIKNEIAQAMKDKDTASPAKSASKKGKGK